jgi:hypothetical protein
MKKRDLEANKSEKSYRSMWRSCCNINRGGK